MAERRDKNTLYERKSKRKGRETNMLGNDQESYWKLKKKKNFFCEETGRNSRGGHGSEKGKCQREHEPLISG